MHRLRRIGRGLLLVLPAMLGLSLAAARAGDEGDPLARANELGVQAVKLYREGRYADAIPLARESLAIREKALGQDHLDVAVSLNILATLLQAQGSYAEPRPLYERALAIDEKAYGKQHPHVATDLNNLAVLLQAQGLYGEARPLLERALAIWEEALGKDHPDVAQCLNNLAVLLAAEGLYADAQPLYERALAIREKALGKEHPGVAETLCNLASLLVREGSYAEARPFFERALAIWEKALGKDHPYVAGSLDSLASLLQDQGFYAEARPLYERALAIRKKTLGEDHPSVAASLNNLASLLEDQGSYAEARPLYERALAIREKTLGKDHPDVAQSLYNLGSLLFHQGSYAEARPLCERALAIFEKALGQDHPYVAASLSGLASLLEAEGLYAEALPLYERALAIREKVLGKEHPAVAASLDDLASVLKAQGSYAEARPLRERALAIREKVLGRDHPAVALSLNDLALLLFEQGSYAEARPLCERALAIREKALGKDHPAVALSLDNLAVLLQGMGSYEEAQPLYERALATAERSLRGSLAGLSSSERVRCSSSLRWQLDVWLDFAPHVGRSGYPEVLRFKGLVARASAAERTLMRSADPETRKTVEELRAAERRLSRLANAMPPAAQAESQAQWRKDYAKTAAERERLSLELSQGFAPYRQALERLDLGLKDVQAQLREGEALVDILRSRGHYLAWVIGRDGEAERLDLGDAGEIERAAEAFVDATRRDAAGRGLEIDEKRGVGGAEAGPRLRALVWEPVAAKLPKGVSTVYVSPDAALAAVPLSALPGKEPGRFLIDEMGIVLLSMAQDLVPSPGPRGEGALVVGGVDFGRAGATKELDADPEVTVLAHAADRAQRGSDFGPLPGTAAEASEVCELLDALALVGPDATEARLRREAQGRRVLHLATHGYVREDLMRGLRATKEEGAKLSEFGLERQLAAGHDPMLLSGLAMAGANTGDGGYGDDGILTAIEASMLDLSACDLVVLSACETATGTAESGEGVLGLVTGFRIAGANRVIGSLWKVDDEATRLLMRRFYEGILRKEKPLAPAESLREAAQWLRTQKGIGGRSFDAPRYWAAFVAYGR